MAPAGLFTTMLLWQTQDTMIEPGRDDFIEWAEDQLRPIHNRRCPECRGVGTLIVNHVSFVSPATHGGFKICRCGGSGKLIDNNEWIRENGYTRVEPPIGSGEGPVLIKVRLQRVNVPSRKLKTRWHHKKTETSSM
jgi:hypothetical protein